MKKILFILITAAFFYTGCDKESPAIVQNDGSVSFTAGDVKIINEGKTVPANIGDTVKQGMTIQTGTKSIAEISFNGSSIRINEKSTVIMNELVKNLADNKEQTAIGVNNGQALFKVARKLTNGEKFNVETPTSIAAVRGTEFLVTTGKDNTRIRCNSGKVAVKESSADDSKFVMIEPGMEALVAKDKGVSIINNDQKTSDKKQPVQKKSEIIPVSGETKGPSTIRADAVKGDIEVKK